MKKTSRKGAQFNASTLRILLSVMLLLIFAGGIAGFYFVHSKLLSYAEEISERKVDAQASSHTITSLQQVQQRLESSSSVSQKIDTLRVDNEFPIFRVVADVRAIASRNNIPITSISQGGGDASAQDAPAGSAATPSTTTGDAATATSEAAASPASDNSKVLSLTLVIGSIDNYQNYLQFLYDIEQNIPKMKVQGVGVSSGSAPAEDGSTPATPSGGISVDPVTIDIYIN